VHCIGVLGLLWAHHPAPHGMPTSFAPVPAIDTFHVDEFPALDPEVGSFTSPSCLLFNKSLFLAEGNGRQRPWHNGRRSDCWFTKYSGPNKGFDLVNCPLGLLESMLHKSEYLFSVNCRYLWFKKMSCSIDAFGSRSRPCVHARIFNNWRDTPTYRRAPGVIWIGYSRDGRPILL
jgi:hypothetical protein